MFSDNYLGSDNLAIQTNKQLIVKNENAGDMPYLNMNKCLQ